MMRVRLLDWKESRQFVVSHQNITERKLIEEYIQELAILDALTEIPNRRYFNYFLDEEWRRARRLQHSVSLILSDIDCFKPFNDNYGHMAGDECLKKVSAELSPFARRPGDLVARYGGEEFAVILGNTDAKAAMKIAEEARANVYDINIPHEFSIAELRVTISVGVATALPTSRSSQNALIEAADGALYAAKKGGRNRVSVHKTVVR